MDYNPNGIWTSKQKPSDPYNPGPVVPPVQQPTVSMEKEVQPPKRNHFSWLPWALLGIFAVVIIGFAFYYFLRPKLVPVVKITFSNPGAVLVGDPFPISVTVDNASIVGLASTSLEIQLPNNLSFIGDPSSQHSIEISLGSLASSTSVSENITLIALAGSGNTANITATASYQLAGSSQDQFETNNSLSVPLGAPVVAFTISAPPSTVSGSPVALTLAYANNTPHILAHAQLSLLYPPAFTFQTSSIPALSGNDVWDISNLSSGATGTIAITGSLASAASGTYPFTGAINLIVATETYAIAGPTVGVALSEPPLGISILADDSSTYISAPNDFITYTVSYSNDAPVALSDVTVTAKLTGAMFNFSTLVTNGSFDSVHDAITWSPSVVPVFASLPPGASGNLTFRIQTLPKLPIIHLSSRDFSLGVQGIISSPSVLPGVAATSTISTVLFSTKVAGSVAFVSAGYRYDTASGILNAGPYPPIANQSTTYTIHWIISDTADSLANVVVSSTLPAGVVFTGNVKSNVSTTPQYDPATGVLTWQIPLVSSGAGIVAPAAQAVFQISEMPAVNQVGQILTLLNGSALQASDTFTGQSLSATAYAVTADLKNDPVASKARNNTVQAQ